MIDLHSHTDESDGSLTPFELVHLAQSVGLQALAITDHDTFEGFKTARPLAVQSGIQLVCGIELSVTYLHRSVHLLGYFLGCGGPSEEFCEWIKTLEEGRHFRNRRLVEKFQAMGLQIALEEFETRGWKRPGRPHFARLMLEKGYTSSIQEAFDKYLDESGSCYVNRNEPTLEEAVARIASAGGIASLPHPGRVSRDPNVIESCLHVMRGLGTSAIEAFHSDHSPKEVATYLGLARKLHLLVTGGSDFHGASKPGIFVGTGKHNNLCLPLSMLDDLRRVPLPSI
jgi:predicted metal-dependent phosphoesterase TrpH